MKYSRKRFIFMALIYSMAIGCLSLVTGTLYPLSLTDGKSKEINDGQEAIDSENNKDNNLMEADMKEKSISSMSIADHNTDPTPIPSPTSTPTPPPIYEFTKANNPDIEKFFQNYYVAINGCDYELIKSILTDPNKAQPLPDLQRETRFLDDIREITCYIAKSYEEGAYIVYVYYEMKYINIKTPYPKLDKFYLVTDKEGALKIFTSEMDETLKNYYEDRDQDDLVQELIQSTKDKAKEALDNDEDLRVYLDALYG